MIITRCIVGLLLVALLLPAYQVKAAASTFTTTQQIGEDNAPPTVPAPVTTTPIAPTQIDIEWGASTDSFGVAGYQLFRDGVQIATTTAIIYFDTNLQPETLYSYYLTAFDAAGNVSTSSVTVATTTLALPVVPVATTTPESSSASRIQLLERNFALVPDTNSARFAWETNIPTQFVLRYGLTREMDDEIVQTSIYRREHTTLISGLTADTVYFYELLLVDSYGREVILRAGQFRTAMGIDTTPPSNIQNLIGQAVSSDVYLSWRNPTDSDFAYVRVVRNFRFFPQNPTDGFVVYEGDATSVIDQGALGGQERQYYTVFAFDGSDNRSSGAVVRVQRVTDQTTDTTTPTSSDLDEETMVTTPTPIDLTQLRLRAEDIMFLQDDGQVVAINGLVTLNAGTDYSISVPATAVPNHLKSIIVTVQHPTNNKITQSFLLRYDEVSDSYLAGIPPFGVLGDSTFTVAVYDYSAAVVHEVTLPVRFVGLDSDSSPFVPEYVSYAWSILWPLIQLLLIGLLFVWFLILWRRRQSDERE